MVLHHHSATLRLHHALYNQIANIIDWSYPVLAEGLINKSQKALNLCVYIQVVRHSKNRHREN